ncbi:MAG TPA: AMP-binding protein, partial [Micromonosporaceae bacterium]|nr:AMP-binding protein [Micromonosporaceae bacterium]
MRELSIPPVAVIPEHATLTDPIWRNAEDYPDLAMFARQDEDGWRDVTAAEFRDQVVALARGLVAVGVATGDRVGLLSRTRYEWTLFDYAIWAAGGVVVPIYETSSPDQIAWVLSDSDAVACVVETAAHAQILAGLRDQLPGLKLIWEIDADAIADLVGDGESVDPAAVEE